MHSKTFASALILAGVLAQPSYVSAQVDSPSNTVSADRDDKGEWGWLGLLGLIGLAGLRRRDRADVRPTARSA